MSLPTLRFTWRRLAFALAVLVCGARGDCRASPGQLCLDGSTRLAPGAGCDPKCGAGQTPTGQFMCQRDGGAFTGVGCAEDSQAPSLPPSDVDAVPDARSSDDMVFRGFKLVDPAACLVWPELPSAVQAFIRAQALKYGPSAAAIRSAKKLGTAQATEFFLNLEQASVLLAQLLCGATERASESDLPEGGSMHPQPFSFGRAMEHWYFGDGSRDPSDATWRRTTLVGYGTFSNDGIVPNASTSVSSGEDLTISSGCDSGGVADSAIGDSQTMTVVFAGHYVGGWMSDWHRSNAHGAQEEKIGTLVPEMMLATEPLRKMGAGLLSNGREDPWLPEAGWYIIGAGSYVKGLGYPRWGSEKIPLGVDDYFAVGNGRRMRRRGIVGIMAKPCNDRGSCGSNSRDHQFRCFNRQVLARDMDSTPAGNLWGIAAGAFDFSNWPAKTAELLRQEKASRTWVLQAGGWGAGVFGCGTLYGGLVQALAAKKGGWRHLRMCWAGRGDPHPTLASRIGYALGVASENAELPSERLMLGSAVDDFASGTARLSDLHFPLAAAQLHRPIQQVLPRPKCAEVQCDRWNNHDGNCVTSMLACLADRSCLGKAVDGADLRDIAALPRGAPGCNPDCSVAAGFCKDEDVPGFVESAGFKYWLLGAAVLVCVLVGVGLWCTRSQRTSGLLEQGSSGSDAAE